MRWILVVVALVGGCTASNEEADVALCLSQPHECSQPGACSTFEHRTASGAVIGRGITDHGAELEEIRWYDPDTGELLAVSRVAKGSQSWYSGCWPDGSPGIQFGSEIGRPMCSDRTGADIDCDDPDAWPAYKDAIVRAAGPTTLVDTTTR